MRFSSRQLTAFFLALTITLQSTACGTLLYPERRGQTSGRIDPAVAILNGIGLLFFIIPGAIAFAVDFSTGAIYLPGGRADNGDGTKDVRIVTVKGEITPERLARILAQETGQHVDLAHATIRQADQASPNGVVALLNRNIEAAKP